MNFEGGGKGEIIPVISERACTNLGSAPEAQFRSASE